MFTVIVCLVWSGKRSTWSPLSSAYSVMPSTEVTFAGCPVRGAAAAFAAAGAPFFFAAGAAAVWAVRDVTPWRAVVYRSTARVQVRNPMKHSDAAAYDRSGWTTQTID